MKLINILKEIGDASLAPYSYFNEDTNLKFDKGMLRGASTWKFSSPENDYEVMISYTGGKQTFPGSNIGVPKFMTYEGHLDTTQEGKPLKVMATITSILRKELLQEFEGKPVIEYLDYIVWPASEEKFGAYNIQSKTQRNKLYKVFLEKQLPQYIDSWVDKDGHFGFKVKKNISEIKIQKPSTIEAFRKDEDYQYYFYIGDEDFHFFNIPNDENCEIWIRHDEYGDINKVEKFLKNKKIPYTWRSENYGGSKYFIIVFNKKFVSIVPEQR